jgi:hypothetical protein
VADRRTEAEKARDTAEAYHKLFSTPLGTDVLVDILNDCGFASLQDVTSESEIARINVGKTILRKAAIWIPEYLRELVSAYMELPIPGKE